MVTEAGLAIFPLRLLPHKVLAGLPRFVVPTNQPPPHQSLESQFELEDMNGNGFVDEDEFGGKLLAVYLFA